MARPTSNCRTAADIAETSLWRVRRDAEGHEGAGRRKRGGIANGGGKAIGVSDDVIGRRDQHQGFAVLRREHQRGNCRCRRGVAPDRLQHDARWRRADFAHLFGQDEAVALVAEQKRRREARAGEAHCRILQHGVVADQAQQLLGIIGARQRPQPCAGATTQNHRMNGARLNSH